MPGLGTRRDFAQRIRGDADGDGSDRLHHRGGAGRARLRIGQADLVLLARQRVRDRYWPLRTASELALAAAIPARPTR
jgi:hypothetical protein